jgi:hypothetical protein
MGLVLLLTLKGRADRLNAEPIGLAIGLLGERGSYLIRESLLRVVKMRRSPVFATGRTSRTVPKPLLKMSAFR